ncbi:hypothetical protein WJ71_25520 [Burkholderia ubonensis]|nr:hypothetical protein WJ71_25520 [Burkholderia ubonensis]
MDDAASQRSSEFFCYQCGKISNYLSVEFDQHALDNLSSNERFVETLERTDERILPIEIPADWSWKADQYGWYE